MKYVISASILTLALAILICALMPRYYLIVAFTDSPVVQMGPFATQAGCERARQMVVDALLGTSDPTYEGARYAVSLRMVCLSSR